MADTSSDQPVRLMAAPFTAFDRDRAVDVDRIADQVAGLRADGVHAAFVCGTTGEGASLTEAERVLVAERWCAEAGPGFDVVVHVGHASLRVATELARHAASTGASAVAAVAPYFHRPRTVEDLVEACAEVSEAAGSLPFFFYHLPDMTGVRVPMAEFIALGRKEIPNFAGVKFTHNDLAEFGQCLQAAGDDLTIMAGRDEILLSSLAAGADSAVGSTYNFAAPIYLDMADAFAGGDLASARRLQQIARGMIDLVQPFGGLPALKAIASIAGVDCGPCRLPLRDLDVSERAGLWRELERIGFVETLEQSRAHRGAVDETVPRAV
jgi:N-acetylneuraminate lyase